MKRIFQACLLAGGFIALLFSCSDVTNLELPESISIKSSDARYSMPVGNYAVSLADYLNAKKLQRKISSAMKPKNGSAEESSLYVYDYNPDGIDSVQEFILHYPVATIPLNPSDYFKEIGLDSKVNEGLEQEITLPGSISFSETYDYPDFNGYLCGLFRTSAVYFSICEPGSTPEVLTTDEIQPYNESWRFLTYGTIADSPLANQMQLLKEIEIPISFDTMTLASGELKIDIHLQPGSTPSGSFQSYLQIVLINSDNVQVGGSGFIRLENEETTSISLAEDKVLTKKMKLQLRGDIKGGTFGNIQTYSISTYLSDSAKIKEVYGLNISKADIGSNGTTNIHAEIPLDSIKDTIKEATIKSGSISVASKLPTNWSGVKTETALGLSGGISLYRDKFENLDPENASHIVSTKAPLDYEKIVPAEQTSLDGSIVMWFEGAHVVLTETGFLLNGKCILDEAVEATVYIDKLTQRDTAMEPIELSFSDDMRTYIKQIELTQFGVEGTLATELKAKNLNVQLEMSSSDLNISPPQTSSANVMEDAAFTLSTPVGWSKVLDLTEATEYKIDFDYKITGENGSNETVLSSFVFGKRYALTPTFTVLVDWTYVVINTSSAEAQSSKTIETGLNIEDVFSDFMKGEQTDAYKDIIEKIKFEGIEGYVYLTKPKVKAGEADPLQNFSTFTGTIKAMYDGNATGDDLIEPNTPLAVKQNAVDFASLADDRLVITNTQLLTDKNCYATKTKENVLCDLINQKPNGLIFDCNLTLSSASGSEITLYKEQFDTFESASDQVQSTAIKISLAILLPLKLHVTDDIVIDDVMAFLGQSLDKDVLDRSDADDKSDFKDYTDLIRFVQCTYDLTNRTGFDMGAALVATNTADIQYLNKTLDFNSGKHNFYLTREEVASLFDNYPFIPKINMMLRSGHISVPRNASLGITAILTAETDGTYEVWKK